MAPLLLNTAFASSHACLNPTSSVVYDGHIPTLTGLKGNMWVSQLLTTNASLEFEFSGTLKFITVRVEMVVFNCPEWGISLLSVVALDASAIPLGFANPTLSSMHTSSQDTNKLALKLLMVEPTDWVHIAEVGIYAIGRTCPEDAPAIPTVAITAAATTPSATVATTTADVTIGQLFWQIATLWKVDLIMLR